MRARIVILVLSLICFSGCHSLIGRGGGLTGEVESGPFPGLRAAGRFTQGLSEGGGAGALAYLVVLSPDLALSFGLDTALLPIDVLAAASRTQQRSAERAAREQGGTENAP